jgi:type IV fimbrial biogenesis protein FimT
MNHCAILTQWRPDGSTSQKAPRMARGRRGFTLVEMVVTVAVIGIILAIGVPSMTGFLASRAAVANAEELAEALRFARSEAVKRGTQVTICSSDTSKSEPTCSNSKSWMSGWIVDMGGKTLRVQNIVRSMKSLDAETDTVTFESNGIASSGATSFVFKPIGEARDESVRTVSLNIQGQVSITKGEPK